MQHYLIGRWSTWAAILATRAAIRPRTCQSYWQEVDSSMADTSHSIPTNLLRSATFTSACSRGSGWNPSASGRARGPCFERARPFPSSLPGRVTAHPHRCCPAEWRRSRARRPYGCGGVPLSLLCRVSRAGETKRGRAPGHLVLGLQNRWHRPHSIQSFHLWAPSLL